MLGGLVAGMPGESAWENWPILIFPLILCVLKKKLDGVMYIFLQGFDGDFFIVYFLQGLAVKIKRSLQGWPVGENT